jgi:phytoene dehydrogenase-like protein
LAEPIYDAVVVGSGPNGLAAAVVLAEAGRSVLVVEAADRIGGGTRSEELTLPGYVHDVCSTIHALALASPLLRDLPLDRHGLDLVQPDLPLAHPLDGGRAVVLDRSVEATAARLGGRDGRAYRRLMDPLVKGADGLFADALGPARPPRHPVTMATFAAGALRSAAGLAGARFGEDPARALFAGLAAHSTLPLEGPVTAAFGLILGIAAHAVGWPLARGGSQAVADALAAHLRSLGGEIETGRFVRSLDELPSARATLCDVTPRALVAMAGDRLPAGYRRRLTRFRHGAGVFKVDWALDAPIPWAAEEVSAAGTVHLGGTLEEIVAGERSVGRGGHPERPYVLLCQLSPFDSSRAPAGKHTGWAYCHVPSGSRADMTAAIEGQVERFAPGFRDVIAARATMDTAAVQRHGLNYVGGDINGGSQDPLQLFTRPVVAPVPYATPARGLYLCSSSTPPGGGVHGMCGYWAARAALRREWPSRRRPPRPRAGRL